MHWKLKEGYLKHSNLKNEKIYSVQNLKYILVLFNLMSSKRRKKCVQNSCFSTIFAILKTLKFKKLLNLHIENFESFRIFILSEFGKNVKNLKLTNSRALSFRSV